jgi:hypothetical protein
MTQHRSRWSIAQRARLARAGACAVLLLVLGVAPASALHTEGILDCGEAGVFHTDAGSAKPGWFEAPRPHSGLFLLEETTSVFVAYSLHVPALDYTQVRAERSPRPLISCTLSSSGPMFTSPWTLQGVFTP